LAIFATSLKSQIRHCKATTATVSISHTSKGTKVIDSKEFVELLNHPEQLQEK